MEVHPMGQQVIGRRDKMMGRKDLNQNQKTAVSYRHLKIAEQRDPARERADIPPGSLCSRTPQKWDEGGG